MAIGITAQHSTSHTHCRHHLAFAADLELPQCTGSRSRKKVCRRPRWFNAALGRGGGGDVLPVYQGIEFIGAFQAADE